ncbi:hypothetical protein cyc_02103 [Cyclospora cayetanensis]|uniref:Uncharacterized protein n=1 Tax=Cyclospora cayetanensis TaxID=88456 RepID=A0A1D3CWP5_9EIME|nr:hypothetical protein cyc_02103 [Cyclospora cayetanensis]
MQRESEPTCSAASNNGCTPAVRTAVEKIHLLPISEGAPKPWIFAALTNLMRECTTVRQYMYVKVKRPAKENRSSRKTKVTENTASDATTDMTDVEYTYIVVACLPHSGVITPSTVVFTSGSPLKPLRRVQLLALVHPNSSYARRAGVSSYSEALQRGLVGEASATQRTMSSSSSSSSRRTRQSNDASRPGPIASASSDIGSTRGVAALAAATMSEAARHQLGSPFSWGVSQDFGERRRRGGDRRRMQEYTRAEDVIAAVLDATDSASQGSSDEDEEVLGGSTAFHLSDTAGNDACATHEEFAGREQQPLQQQRTLQLNFNFPCASPSSLGELAAPRDGAHASADSQGKAPLNTSFSEQVLFHDFVAPYFRARSSLCFPPPSPASPGSGNAACSDTAVVVFPGKQLVIKDLTFVVWATDPENNPGFVRKDTAIYISVDPWGEYRRVHILPFADTLPTTYSFRLFEDYLQPFLKEQPWRLIRKGDIFTFRGVEFKVIATEPSTIPVARVGPETVVHFEGMAARDLGELVTRIVCAALLVV